jgi:hypothetical protein
MDLISGIRRSVSRCDHCAVQLLRASDSNFAIPCEFDQTANVADADCSLWPTERFLPHADAWRLFLWQCTPASTGCVDTTFCASRVSFCIQSTAKTPQTHPTSGEFLDISQLANIYRLQEEMIFNGLCRVVVPVALRAPMSSSRLPVLRSKCPSA